MDYNKLWEKHRDVESEQGKGITLYLILGIIVINIIGIIIIYTSIIPEGLYKKYASLLGVLYVVGGIVTNNKRISRLKSAEQSYVKEVKDNLKDNTDIVGGDTFIILPQPYEMKIITSEGKVIAYAKDIIFVDDGPSRYELRQYDTDYSEEVKAPINGKGWYDYGVFNKGVGSVTLYLNRAHHMKMLEGNNIYITGGEITKVEPSSIMVVKYLGYKNKQKVKTQQESVKNRG